MLHQLHHASPTSPCFTNFTMLHRTPEVSSSKYQYWFLKKRLCRREGWSWVSDSISASGLSPTRKYALVQFLTWPLRAGSKTEQTSVDPDVKMSNVTAKLHGQRGTNTALLSVFGFHINSCTSNTFLCITSVKIIWSNKTYGSQSIKSLDAIWLTASH